MDLSACQTALTEKRDVEAEERGLMLQVKEGRSEALKELYQKYKYLLKSLVVQIMNDETEAEDIVQEVFIQLWEKPAGYSPDKGRLSSWLYTLTRRRAIDRIRQRAAYQKATDRYHLACKRMEKALEDIHSAERAAQREDLKTILHRHLETLPPNQREAVNLAFFESKTQREISSITGTPLGTVKTRIELGIKKLTHALAGARREFA